MHDYPKSTSFVPEIAAPFLEICGGAQYDLSSGF